MVGSHRVISVANKGRLLEIVTERLAVTVPTSAIMMVVVMVFTQVVVLICALILYNSIPS